MKIHSHILPIFFVAACLMLMTACSADIFSDGPDEKAEMTSTIAFSVTDDQNLSRGLPVDSLAQLADFRADAYLHRNGQSTPLFSNQRQLRVSGGDVYHGDHAYLWPTDQGDRLAFVAVAPYDVAQGLNITESGDFTYTVPENAVDQQDLLFATAEDVEGPEQGSIERAPVPLNFKHILTQVRFVFGRNEANYWRNLTVHSIRVENVSGTGTWNSASGTWDNLDSPTNAYEIVSTSDSITSGIIRYKKLGKEIWEKEFTMFLMPQTLSAGARVAVDMSYQSTEADTDSPDLSLERKTYYLYLDGKKLLPGHMVTVEINSNYTYDCSVVNPDGTDVALYPLSGNAQDVTLKIRYNSGAGAMKILVAPDCQSFVTISVPGSQSAPGTECDVSDLFTLHVDENATGNDRFIRLVIYEAHKGDAHWSNHIVVLKQHSKSSYGEFSDDPAHGDILVQWGFNWPQPILVEFTFPSAGMLNWVCEPLLKNHIDQWAIKNNNKITFNYDILRGLARQPNSYSDGLANTQAINTNCYFINPFNTIKYFWLDCELDEFMVNGITMDDGQTFLNTYNIYNASAVMEIAKLNGIGKIGGISNSDFVSGDIKIYLPAIEQLETIVNSGSSPLVAGRTYWSSTVDSDGEPIALTINADGSCTRCKPGADTQAYAHPVRDVRP